jgi:hypothetical protein
VLEQQSLLYKIPVKSGPWRGGLRHLRLEALVHLLAAEKMALSGGGEGPEQVHHNTLYSRFFCCIHIVNASQ